MFLRGGYVARGVRSVCQAQSPFARGTLLSHPQPSAQRHKGTRPGMTRQRKDLDESDHRRSTDVVGAVSNILYNIPEPDGEIRRHTFSVLVEDEPGVLSRVSGLLSGRGTNIQSLTVSESEVKGLSRMTLSVMARESEVDKIIHQVEDVEEALAVFTYSPASVVEREVVLMKLDTTVPTADGPVAKFEALSEKRNRVMALAKLFEAELVDVGSKTITIQLTSWPRRIDAFIKFAGPYGIIETCRSGVVAMSRSSVGSYEDHEIEEEMMDVSQLPPS